MWVECGGRVRHDHANGILRSSRSIHSVSFKMSELEAAGSYTVHLRPILERKPYFSETGEVQSFHVGGFRPVAPRNGILRVLFLADTHSLVDAAIRSAGEISAQAFGGGGDCGEGAGPDLVILAGDIPEDCGAEDRMAAPHLIVGRITGGRVPCVFARGNHDLRGVFAERYAELTPTSGGRSYYEFRAGPVWGLVLDTGEDKPDGHPEYGNTVCCSEFRDDEEAWLKRVCGRGAPADARWRLLVCHNPFAFRLPPPFDIEQDRWRRWCEMMRPLGFQAMLTGHMHQIWLDAPGDEHDTYGAPCPVVCASMIDRAAGKFTAAAVSVTEGGALRLQCTGRPETLRLAHSSGPAETQRVAREWASALGPGWIWALSGDLGAGKTCFVQGVCDALGIRVAASSPTFAIANEYRDGETGPRLVHLDLYRLEGPADLDSIGWDDYLDGADTLAVEWPDRAEGSLPPERTVSVELKRVPGGGPDERFLKLMAPSGAI